MLIPDDDYPLHQVALPLAHVMDGHPNAYDRFWFNGYTEDHYFAVAMGLYPNRGVTDGAFCVSTGDRQYSVFTGDQLHGRGTTIGPLRIEIVEPLRVNRVVVDAPERGIRADLLYTLRTEAFEEPRQTMFDGPRIFLDVSRATQLGTWEGWIETPHGRIDIEAGTYGTKDRSWGVRPVGEPLPGAPSERVAQLCFLWAPLNFPDACFHYMSFDDDRGQPLSRTAAYLPLAGHGEIRHEPGAISIAAASGTRRADAATLHVGDEIIELTPLRTFYMRGVGYNHPQYAHGRWHGGPYVDGEVLELAELSPLEYHNIHVQQVVRATWRDQIGLGVLESLIIGPYAPLGLTELLDGA